MNTLISKNAQDNEFIKCIKNIFYQTKKNFNIELWNGKTISYSHNPEFTLRFLDKNTFKKLIATPNIMAFAKAFIDKKFDIEGNIVDALKLKDDISSIEMPSKYKIILFLNSIDFLNNIHTKKADKKCISHHYDVSNNFYKLFLEDSMMYSCAYFKENTSSLTEAQENKMEHICKKLMLKPNEMLLDVGCGWGSMIMWAAKNYGVKAKGITISKEQYKYAKQMIKTNGLEEKCCVELKDYRDIKGEAIYDKIVSIGMFEHVGSKNLPVYFNNMNRLLKEDGLFLNHGITTRKDSNLSKSESEFIKEYIFPGGELENISYVLDSMENSKFDIFDVECLREHYYKTLKCWVENLKNNRQKAIKLTDEKTYRTWLLYMSGCAINFESDCISVYQVLLGKKRKEAGFAVPLTREYIYN